MSVLKVDAITTTNNINHNNNHNIYIYTSLSRAHTTVYTASMLTKMLTCVIPPTTVGSTLYAHERGTSHRVTTMGRPELTGLHPFRTRNDAAVGPGSAAHAWRRRPSFALSFFSCTVVFLELSCSLLEPCVWSYCCLQPCSVLGVISELTCGART